MAMFMYPRPPEVRKTTHLVNILTVTAVGSNLDISLTDVEFMRMFDKCICSVVLIVFEHVH